MEQATISQLKNSLSAYVRKVKLGESVLVFERNTPVARLVPIEPPSSTRVLREEAASYSTNTSEAEPEEEMIDSLVREGRLIRGNGQSPIDIVRSWPPLKGVDLLAALLTEREEVRRSPYR